MVIVLINLMTDINKKYKYKTVKNARTHLIYPTKSMNLKINVRFDQLHALSFFFLHYF